MKAGLSFGKIIFFLGVIAGAMLLSYLIDDNLEIAWPTNVLRNWQEYGLMNLHGQLVYSVGGYQALDHPQIYKGMSPVFLYPVFFATKIFSWAGLDSLVFHILLMLAVLWAIWNLVGRNHFALLAAAVTVLCPGYLRWPKDFDPGALSVLPALPYAVIVLWILRKPKLTPAGASALVVLTLAMISTNWTSVWICGPCVFLFWGMPGLNRRGVILLILVIAIGIPAIGGVSVAAKYGAMVHSGEAHSSGVLAGYTWGNNSYGQGLTTGRAVVRLTFANGIGLLPLWLVLVYAMMRRVRSGGFSWLMLMPLVAAAGNLVVMRNYFGHHPWMAGPVLVVGAVFTLALLRAGAREEAEVPFKVIPPLAVGCFLYGFVVLLFLRANETELLSLVKLVRQHTARSDTLVVEKSDSATAPLALRLDEILDRHIIVADNLQDLAGQEGHYVILSSVKRDDSLPLIAQSQAESQSLLTKVGGWFNRTIAKRNRGDRLDLSESYFLYGAKPAVTHGMPD